MPNILTDNPIQTIVLCAICLVMCGPVIDQIDDMMNEHKGFYQWSLWGALWVSIAVSFFGLCLNSAVLISFLIDAVFER